MKISNNETIDEWFWNPIYNNLNCCTFIACSVGGKVINRVLKFDFIHWFINSENLENIRFYVPNQFSGFLRLNGKTLCGRSTKQLALTINFILLTTFKLLVIRLLSVARIGVSKSWPVTFGILLQVYEIRLMLNLC